MPLNSGPTTAVTLIDGTITDSGSEAHRHECEARYILAMPTKADRQDFLNGHRDMHTGRHHPGVHGRRGADEAARLRATMLVIWEKSRGKT